MIESQLTRAEQVIMEARGRAASADKNRKGKGQENKKTHNNNTCYLYHFRCFIVRKLKKLTLFEFIIWPQSRHLLSHLF